MIVLKAENTGLYFGIILAAALLVFVALGPGLFPNTNINPYHWQYYFFDALCHQDPSRSLYINSHQMAVCARCLGIYISFLTGWLLLPVIVLLQRPANIQKKIFLIAAIILNSTDVIGNYYNFWSNTLNSRLLLGSLLGLAAAMFLADSFFKIKKSE